LAKRPRSHQLEDESITAFRAARPSRWPVRKKDDDYGIDLEVEIFDDNDISTGLLFFVQLKATDAESERKVALEREYLEDICRYDSPTIIVRYFARDGVLYWAWATDLLAQIPKEQASKTFRFEEQDILNRDAFDEIVNALKFTRFVDSIHGNSPLPIRMKLDCVQGRRKLELRRSLERIEEANKPAITFFEADTPQPHSLAVLEVTSHEVRICFGPRYTTLLKIKGIIYVCDPLTLGQSCTYKGA
jgi:hypothetical protein